MVGGKEDKAKMSLCHISQIDCLKSDGYWIDIADVEGKITRHGREHTFVQSNVFGEFAAKVEGGLLSLKEFNGKILSLRQSFPRTFMR